MGVEEEKGAKPVCKPFKRSVRISGKSGRLTVPKWALQSEQVKANKEYVVVLFDPEEIKANGYAAGVMSDV